MFVLTATLEILTTEVARQFTFVAFIMATVDQMKNVLNQENVFAPYHTLRTYLMETNAKVRRII